jgi:hypothetical protein
VRSSGTPRLAEGSGPTHYPAEMRLDPCPETPYATAVSDFGSGHNSVVECQLPKLKVAGSNPVARSSFLRPPGVHFMRTIIYGL